MIDRVRALGALRDRRERLLLLRVLLGAPWIRGLMVLPLPTVSAILSRRRRGRPPELTAERVAAVVATAQRVGSPLVARGCLTRGVALIWLLGTEDLRLCFGLGGPADDFSGHCWLEREGRPFLERVDPRERFPEQYAIPARAPGPS